MRTRVKTLTKAVLAQHVDTSVCHHFWLIESAKGHTSQGVCKLCGARKEFYNSIPEPDSALVKKHVPFQEMPELSVPANTEQNSSS